MNEIGKQRYWLNSNADLAQASAQWRNVTVLGIDTEFIRTDTFYPIPALVQVSDGQCCWLIDVLAINEFAPLIDVMCDTTILKVVHAAGEDLEVFDQLLGVLPQPLFDTQIAAAFCSHGPSIGYSRLVQTLLDEELSKDQCRSDWLARPLTNEQQHYACLDVLYLPALYRQLQEELASHQRAAWCEEDNLRQLTRYREQRNSGYSLDRINNAWRLNPQERQRLWHLVLGRDALAREHNRPRNHIAKDFALLDLARRPPRRREELAAIEGLRPAGIRQFGDALITLANNTPVDLVCPPLPQPLGRAEGERLRQLRDSAELTATALGLPLEILVRKQDLEQLVRQYAVGQSATMPARWQGWRENVIGTALLAQVASWT